VILKVVHGVCLVYKSTSKSVVSNGTIRAYDLEREGFTHMCSPRYVHSFITGYQKGKSKDIPVTGRGGP
jgi:hypothetical protein